LGSFYGDHVGLFSDNDFAVFRQDSGAIKMGNPGSFCLVVDDRPVFEAGPDHFVKGNEGAGVFGDHRTESTKKLSFLENQRMDITPEELKELQKLGEDLASGKQLEEVSVTYEEDGQEKTLVFRDPLSLSLIREAALELHRRHNPGH
jgi:hypothetical protein